MTREQRTVAALGLAVGLVLADSSVFSSPLADSVSVLDTIPIPANAPTGALSIAPFVIDSLGHGPKAEEVSKREMAELIT